MDKKICSTCGEKKPATIEYFNKRKAGKYTNKEGLHKQCKICESKQRKQHYEENKERIIEKAQSWNESNKERVKENHREYQKNNREILTAKKREWISRGENKDRIRDYNKKYSRTWRSTNKVHIKKYLENNKENTRAYSRIATQRRNALKRNLPANLTAEQWEQIKSDFNHTCAYCGKELPLTQDHFVPLSKNGEYSKDNIIPVCRTCNCSKGAKLFESWYPTYTHYDKQREQKILNYLNYSDNTQQLSISI